MRPITVINMFRAILQSHESRVAGGKKTGADGIGGELAQFVASKSLLGVGQQVFIGEIGAEEGWVVGVERDQQSGIKVAAQRVGRKGWADAGAHI